MIHDRIRCIPCSFPFYPSACHRGAGVRPSCPGPVMIGRRLRAPGRYAYAYDSASSSSHPETAGNDTRPVCESPPAYAETVMYSPSFVSRSM